MNEELLIRRLIWQNGLYRGLLAMSVQALAGEIECDECQKLAEKANQVLRAPLPVFLEEAPAVSPPSPPAGDGA